MMTTTEKPTVPPVRSWRRGERAPKSGYISIYLRDADIERVNEAAEAEGLTRNEMVRQAIHAFLDQLGR